MEVTHQWRREPDPVISQITDDELLARSQRFTHIYEDKAGIWRAVITQPTMEYLRETSCIWDPLLGDPVPWILGEARAFPFFVSCDYYGLFKPSVAEVLTQAPADELTDAGFDAFYIGDHVDILASGRFQRGTAMFVRKAGAMPDAEAVSK